MMIAGFKSDVQDSTLCSLTGFHESVHFGMRASDELVVPFAHHCITLYHDRSHHRVGTRTPLTFGGES